MHLSDFDFQMLVWGYHVKGTGDVAAHISENRDAHNPMVDYWRTGVGWDYDQEYLETVFLGEDVPPDYFALWWVCEHERRTT